MRIGRLDHRKADTARKRKREGPAGVAAAAGTFADALQSKQEEPRQQLDELLATIDQAAKDLLENPTYEKLQQYRKLVGDFLREASRAVHRVKEQVGFDSQGNRRVYVIVNTVNRQLHELTVQVLNSQAEGLELVRRLDEIRGLLLDLYS